MPDVVATEWAVDQRRELSEGLRPSDALHDALNKIRKRYGTETAEAVALQLEYPWPRED